MKTTRKRKQATRKVKKEKVWVGSGNVFADLGFADAEERLLKAKLTSEIAQLIEKKRVDASSSRRANGLGPA